jgi:acetyl-CoA/propionyl-CoA carboxylase carboxyl transferase subunit
VVYDSSSELEVTESDRKLNTLVPDSPNQPYDMHTVIEHIVDDGHFLEVQPLFAPNILIGFARIDGRSVGIVANQPSAMAGTLNIDAGEKAARFVRFCDAFSIPILTLVDVPGYLPGTDQEWAGVIRRGAKLIYAYAEATVPLVTVITRKAYGGAFVAMNSKSLGATRVFAWPQAEVSVMGAVAAVRVLHRRILADLPADQREDMELELAAEHEKVSGGVARAIEIGAVDEMIEPDKTRSSIAKVLSQAEYQRGSHGNIPL